MKVLTNIMPGSSQVELTLIFCSVLTSSIREDEIQLLLTQSLKSTNEGYKLLLSDYYYLLAVSSDSSFDKIHSSSSPLTSSSCLGQFLQGGNFGHFVSYF